MNIIANLTEKTEFLKYITPYGYTDPSSVINDKTIDPVCLLIGSVFFFAGIIIAYIKYTKKDIL